ncbi:MAG: hypothetical protein E7397_02610 [Ruminococcaceae bacterium]|nr:hypothetical protein [Oscillospiraceae bacterium]
MLKENFSFLYGEELVEATSIGADGICRVDDALTVQLVRKDYPELCACEWVLYFENPSNHNSKILSQICDCDICLSLPKVDLPKSGYMPAKDGTCITQMKGCIPGFFYQSDNPNSATEFSPMESYLNREGQTITAKNIGHRSSDALAPFFKVSADGKGAIVAIGWTGAWQADFIYQGGDVRIKTGMQNAKFYLKPGERLRTTSVLIMEYDEEEKASNQFRRLVKNYFSHKACTGATREGLLAFELWGGLTSEEMIKRLNELREHQVHFEDVWIDAGWYGTCTKCDEPFSGDWAQYTGDWRINERVHPDLFLDVKKATQEAGMNLMLWLEPERVTQKAPALAEHPEWFLSDGGDGDRILYYGNEDALQYVFETLCGFVEDLDLSCYRQDFNCELTNFFRNSDEPNRMGITEIYHINGMYRLWDMLLEKYPHLIIDNCSSGGRRIDIETLRRSIPFFRSDYQCEFNANPEVLQVVNSNISYYLPYNGCTNKTKNDLYSLRSSYSSSWGGAFYNAVFQTMNAEELDFAAEVVEEYRSIRSYFAEDFYNLASNVYDLTSWTVWQYHNPKTDSGIVLAFRREASPFETISVSLKGIEGTYNFVNRDTMETFASSYTLSLHLPEKRSCVLLEYKK